MFYLVKTVFLQRMSTRLMILWRVEFQFRGSAHIHCLLWLKGAPNYEPNNAYAKKACIQFIDKFISCKYTDEYKLSSGGNLIELQRHKHKETCKKNKKNDECRFHIPYPIMKNTDILEPFDDNVSEKTKKSLSCFIN